MFGNGRWRFYRDGIPVEAAEKDLGEALAGMNAGNAAELADAAGRLVALIDFSPEQAAVWRERFAQRRDELLRGETPKRPLRTPMGA